MASRAMKPSDTLKVFAASWLCWSKRFGVGLYDYDLRI